MKITQVAKKKADLFGVSAVSCGKVGIVTSLPHNVIALFVTMEARV